MTQSVRDSDMMAAMAQASGRPLLPRNASSTYSSRGVGMDGLVLSFSENQKVQQLRTQAQTRANTAANAQTFTTVRPTAVAKPTCWDKFCAHLPGGKAPSTQASVAVPAPLAGGAWVYCSPPIPIGSLDGLRAGYQVRTTQGMDMIFGVPMPTNNDGTEMVTAYRDLTSVADEMP